MRTIPAAVLAGAGFFSDPTLWSDFSPARFGPAVVPFLAALVCTTVAVLPARWLAFRLGAVAEPGERRIHSQPTARLGGLAMYLGFGLAAALFSTNPATLGLLLSAAVITTLMVFDDIRGIRPIFKLVFQIAASLLAIVGFGISIHFIGLPGGHPINLVPAVAIPLTLLWFVGLQNTVNLIDGVDGLAAGVVAIVAATLLLAAINRGESDIIILAGALIGACVGFLFFNWHPARVFMGDSGSNFLGFTLAALSVLSVAKGTVVLALIVPVAALAIPIVDTAWAIVRRRLRGRSIATPDTGHLHHRLLDFGLSPQETALVFYFGTAIFAAVGLAIYGHRRVLFGAIVLLGLGIVVILLRRFRRVSRG
ncbi:MAG: undecaprenyl/decaprenyl-phosphate alpha-N-acetylglucosaminyl 1-phosphate transferase [Candidatus Dormibacteraeota bacterium]|nr:undecaprenyl/decaprenyl-phosphate alpha-N-acetylglucosaminyl 1-phosphate transferase [Candidatus Dormibacteraeota bacterium]